MLKKKNIKKDIKKNKNSPCIFTLLEKLQALPLATEKVSLLSIHQLSAKIPASQNPRILRVA